MFKLISDVPVRQESDYGWHALYTQHRHEKAVTHILSRKAFEVFLPLNWTVHRWKDRNKQLWLPLFPCYVFFKGGLKRQLDILNTPGVYSVVSSASRFAVIPDEEINVLRQMMENSTRVEPHPFLKSGDRVRVKSGALVGIEGILIRKKGQFRLVVSVEILGKSAAAEIDVSTVERVSARNAAAA